MRGEITSSAVRPVIRIVRIARRESQNVAIGVNALLSAARGATRVSFHHGGGLSIGYSQHTGFALIAEGPAEAGEKTARILWNDPATGTMRHADAGYESAITCAAAHGLDLPGF
jgi:urocanate hydratase